MPTVAAPFNDAGYDTAWFGKWHIDGGRELQRRGAFHTVPRHRRGGFKTWIGYEINGAWWDSWVHGHTAAGDEVGHYRLPGYETDDLTDLLLDYLRRPDRKSRPFFASVAVSPPHNPYEAPEEWMRRHTPGDVQLRRNVPDVPRIVERARCDLAGYYAMVENLDWNVGRIRAALDAAGLADNTHIIFFSDHGDMLGSHGQFHKTSPWEEAIRVPFIIGGGAAYVPGKGTEFQGDRLTRVQRQPVPVNHVDVGPTSLGLCGIPVPEWMAGTDYSGYRRWTNPVVNEPDSAFLQMVVAPGHPDSVDRPWRGVVTRDGWKYACLEGQPWLMFNLNEDPYEFVNLAHNTVFRAERRRLHDRLAAWIHDTGDQFRLPEL
jgi:arylsulfatase A-like enzyme